MNLLNIISSTRDSIQIRWTHPTGQDGLEGDDVLGYRIEFQALGSLIVYSAAEVLGRDDVNIDIKNLHENTVYNFCVKTLYNASQV